MDLITVREGKANLDVPNPDTYKLDAKMPVFFNKIMVTNRDISIILLRSQNRKLRCLDLLGASGARGIRIALEVPGSEVTINDANPSAVELIKKNAKRNRVKIAVSHASANRFLRESNKKWDYIDVDPFGTPAPFIENALKQLSTNGIIGVTATDTSALCGTYPSATRRKYQSTSMRSPIMHETGIRILIDYVQREGKKQNIHLRPIFSHSTDHYVRIYLKRVPKSVDNSGYISYNFKTGEFKTRKTKPRKDFVGPLWLGDLWDKKVVKKMYDFLHDGYLNDKIDYAFHVGTVNLSKYLKEAKVGTIGFYDIHALAKIYRLPQLPKRDNIIEQLREKGFSAVRTHFTPTGIRTSAKLKDVLTLCRDDQARK